MKRNELLQEKGQVVTQMRAFLDKASAEKRDLNASETEQYNKLDTRLSEINANLKRLDTLEAEEKSLQQRSTDPVRPGAAPKDDDHRIALVGKAIDLANRLKGTRLAFTIDPVYGAAFEDYARRNQVQQALQVGTNSEGGYVVPHTYETVLVEALAKQSNMRNICSVLTSASDRNIPLESSYGAAAWVDEEGDYPESDSAFDRATSSAYKLGRIMKVSEELLQDAFFDLAGYIARAYAKSFGDGEETGFYTGDGNKKPTGLAVTSQKGIDAASKTAIAADEFIDLFYSVKPGYRKNARWSINDGTARLLRKLKDSTGQYIWQPGLVAGQPDALLNKPVEYSDAVDAIGSSKKIAFFGDFSYYQIVDRVGVSMQRLNELYAKNGQVGFKMFKRTDGHLLVPEAVKHILCPV